MNFSIIIEMIYNETYWDDLSRFQKTLPGMKLSKFILRSNFHRTNIKNMASRKPTKVWGFTSITFFACADTHSLTLLVTIQSSITGSARCHAFTPTKCSRNTFNTVRNIFGTDRWTKCARNTCCASNVVNILVGIFSGRTRAAGALCGTVLKCSGQTMLAIVQMIVVCHLKEGEYKDEEKKMGDACEWNILNINKKNEDDTTRTTRRRRQSLRHRSNCS